MNDMNSYRLHDLDYLFIVHGRTMWLGWSHGMAMYNACESIDNGNW